MTHPHKSGVRKLQVGTVRTFFLRYLLYRQEERTTLPVDLCLFFCLFFLYLHSHVTGKLKEWSLVLYGTSVHPYSSRSDKPRSVVESPVEDEYSEEYVGKSTLVMTNIRKVARVFE